MTEIIQGHTFEYYEDEHLYLVDGVIKPSITQILKAKFPNKYSGISEEVLTRAASEGTKVHEAIEQYCKGIESDLPEVAGFAMLQRLFKFEVVENEVPVILYMDGEPAACGRLDLSLYWRDRYGGADIKRTSKLDKEYLAYQLNLYRIAYKQTYGIDWEFLWGIHLRGDVRRIVELPINEEMAIEAVKEYMKGQENEQSNTDWQTDERP